MTAVHVPAFLTHVDGDTCVLLVEQLRAPLECPCIGGQPMTTWLQH